MLSIYVLLAIFEICVLFILATIVPTLTIERYQAIDLTITSIFLLLIFGGLGRKFNNNENYLNTIGLITLLFAAWYYLTIRFANLLSADSNSVIRY